MFIDGEQDVMEECTVSYHGDGPDWAMIGAKRRAEREANEAQSHPSLWRRRAETLAALVFETADQVCPSHRAGQCQCRRCWEQRVADIFGTSATDTARATPAGSADPFWILINKISREAAERRQTP